jgi:hypothetical protein
MPEMQHRAIFCAAIAVLAFLPLIVQARSVFSHYLVSSLRMLKKTFDHQC